MILPDLKTPLLWALGLALVAALATAGIERTRAAGARADAATARKQMAEYRFSVSESTRILQAANDRRAADNTTRQLEATNAARNRESALRSVADDLRVQRDRLLIAARAARTSGRDPVPGTAAGAEAQPPDPVTDVLGQCTAEVQELAGAADAHASDVQALTEAWPR